MEEAFRGFQIAFFREPLVLNTLRIILVQDLNLVQKFFRTNIKKE